MNLTYRDVLNDLESGRIKQELKEQIRSHG